MNKTVSRTMLLLCFVGMLATACQHSAVLETRGFDMSSIETSMNNSISESDSSVITSDTDRVKENLSFELIISDDLLVEDHGKKTANVYRAIPGETTTTWMGNEDWQYAPLLIDWCIGKTISNADILFVSEDEDEKIEYSTISYDQALENIGRVNSISLNEISSLSSIPTGICDYSSGKTALAWDYSLEGYPWHFYDGVEWFSMSTDIKTLQFIRLTPYLDGIPVGGGVVTGDFPAYEWEGVINPAGMGSFPCWGLTYINTQNQFVDLTAFNFRITDTILKDQAILEPQDCLDAIATAFSYDTSHISGKTINVYGMELRYLIVDEFPLCIEDNKEEYVLIPIWTVHATIYDDTKVTYGTTSINAITGKSVFSETIGPDDPKYYSAYGVTS